MKATALKSSEYAPFYEGYIKGLGDSTLCESLICTSDDLLSSLQGLSESQANYRYAEGKWSIKELVQHIIDSERVLAYRALRFARRDLTPLPGFDEDWYVDHSGGDRRNLQELLEEFRMLRSANLAMFKSFDDEMLRQTGQANNCSLSVRALGFIIAGHLLHHLKVIRSFYLKSEGSR